MAYAPEDRQSPELVALEKNIPDLCEGIPSISTVTHFAQLLVEKDFITYNASRSILRTLGISEQRKCNDLLDAVREKVRTDPAKFETFVGILRQERALRGYANSLISSRDNARAIEDTDIASGIGDRCSHCDLPKSSLKPIPSCKNASCNNYYCDDCIEDKGELLKWICKQDQEAKDEPKKRFMLTTKRGVAVLVTCDYMDTPGVKPLEQTQKDFMEMKKTFKQFDYDVIELQNKTKPTIIQLVKQLSDFLWYYEGDGKDKAIFFAFCGHGTSHNRVRANDGRYFSLKDVVELLVDPEKIGEVGHKIPKFFLIDACRGDDKSTHPLVGLDTLRGKFRIDYATTQGRTSFDSLWMREVALKLRECGRDETYQSVIENVKKLISETLGQESQTMDQQNIGTFKLHVE